MAKRDKTEDLVKELIHEEDWKRMNATAELLKRGPEAVRHLLTGLTDENSRVRAEAVAMLKSQDPTARRMAAEALEQLADPRSADAWIEAMGDPALRAIASRSLKHIAELRERIEGILNGLRDIEDTVALEEARVGVVMNLIALGRPAVADLLVALEDEYWMVRAVAAQALAPIWELRALEPF